MMKRFSPKIRRAGEWLKRVFLSKPQRNLRAAFRTEAREQREKEAERLDRLRNPDNYRGR